MTKIILVVIGVLLAAVAALMTIFYGGDVYTKYSVEAEAARLVNESAQIENAVEIFYVEKGRLPGQGEQDQNVDPIQSLIDSKYLSEAPKGNDDLTGDWSIDYTEGHIHSTIGTIDSPAAMDVCHAARRQLNFPNPENVLQCDGSDSPGGKLNGLDPCCLRTPAL